MTDFKPLRDALEAGPTDGPWNVSNKPGGANGISNHLGGYVAFTSMPRTVSDERFDGESWLDMRQRTQEDRLSIEREEVANRAYIAAANPATIRALLNERDALLARLDAAEAALNDAATSLETISRLAGKEAYPDGTITCMGSFSEVRGYAISRAAVARAALTQGA